MKKITAIFTGQNLSLGYVTGQRYDLVLKQSIREITISIHRADGSGVCEYSNTINFLDNWTDIKVIEN